MSGALMWISTGHSPLVAHFPGNYYKSISNPVGKFFNQLSSRIQSLSFPKNMTVLTWNSHAHKSTLEKHLNKFNAPHMVLGRGCKWHFRRKIDLTLSALRGISTPYVMGLDANDVLVWGDFQRAVNFLAASPHGMLLNSDYTYFPTIPTVTDDLVLFQEETGHKYLNSGVWIAEYDTCLEFFENANSAKPPTDLVSKPTPPYRLASGGICTPTNPPHCDQAVFNYMFKKMHPKMGLDYDCDLFIVVNMSSVGDIRFHLPLL